MNTDTTMQAGLELTRLLTKTYESERGVHAETVIGAIINDHEFFSVMND